MFNTKSTILSENVRQHLSWIDEMEAGLTDNVQNKLFCQNLRAIAVGDLTIEDDNESES